MPRLASFWKRSANGRLRSSLPMVTPVAWTTFATGCDPISHGIHEFQYLDAKTRSIRSNHAGRVRSAPFWQVVDDAGGEVVSLNLPMTYPPPPARGLIVSGADSPGLDWAFARCPDFGEEVKRLVPAYTHKILWKRRPRSLEEMLEQAARCRAVFRARAHAAELADARSDWTVLTVHFHNLDSLQHRLWPELELEADSASADPIWSRETISCLKALDESIGRLLELASKRDAAVVAVSDHGFGPCKALVNVNGLLQHAGLQSRLPYGTRFRYRFRRVAERLRRWRTRNQPGGAGRRLPRSIEGQVGCDWKKTVAFAPFGQLSGCVFLTPEAASNASRAERIKRDVVELLQNAHDPETGAKLFIDAFQVAERYRLDPIAEGLPDVLAFSSDGYQAQAKWNPFRPELLLPDPNLPATHYRQGVIAIDAPDLRPGDHLNADLRDVAPTALALLGLRIPEGMNGRVLHEAFEEPLVVRRGDRRAVVSDPDFDARLVAAGFGDGQD
ncbi:MAG: hypothetical protein NVSMB14_12470 [Isosphaeraceae bacterium]